MYILFKIGKNLKVVFDNEKLILIAKIYLSLFIPVYISLVVN